MNSAPTQNLTSESFATQRLLRVSFLLLFPAAIFVVTAFPGHLDDAHCWTRWAVHIHQHGITNAYVGSDTDYPPVMQYIVWGFGAVMGDAETIEHNYAYLRLFFYLAELIGIAIVWKWCERRVAFSALAIFSFLNIAASYNTLIWGQLDSLLTTGGGALHFIWRGGGG